MAGHVYTAAKALMPLSASGITERCENEEKTVEDEYTASSCKAGLYCGRPLRCILFGVGKLGRRSLYAAWFLYI